MWLFVQNNWLSLISFQPLGFLKLWKSPKKPDPEPCAQPELELRGSEDLFLCYNFPSNWIVFLKLRFVFFARVSPKKSEGHPETERLKDNNSLESQQKTP